MIDTNKLCFFFHTDKSDYQKHYSYYSGNDASYPKYNVTNVLASPTATAIASVSTSVLTAAKIKYLRKKATLVCKNFTNSSSCINRTCLFNIYEDPCEITDLSSKRPQVRLELNKHLCYATYFKLIIKTHFLSYMYCIYVKVR